MNFSNQLSKDIFNYLISDNEYISNVRSVFKIESSVIFDSPNGSRKSYGFIGNGCGITYLVIDGRSRKSKELENLCFEIRRNVNEYIHDNIFNEKEKEYFANFGCPVMAVLQQDQQIQIEFYSRLVKYAKEVMGIKKIGYRSVLD